MAEALKEAEHEKEASRGASANITSWHQDRMQA